MMIDTKGMTSTVHPFFIFLNVSQMLPYLSQSFSGLLPTFSQQLGRLGVLIAFDALVGAFHPRLCVNRCF